MNWGDLLGPLIASGAPTLGKIIGSALPIPGGALIGEAAGNLLARHLGADPNPEAVKEKLENLPPEVALAKVRAAEAEAATKWPALAEMAKAQHEAETAQWQATLADIQGARSQTVALAKAGSGIAWGAPVVSGLVVVGFIAILVLWIMHPPGTPDQVITLLVGSLSTAFGAVVHYWLGSTTGSKSKDNAFADIVANAQATMAKLTRP